MIDSVFQNLEPHIFALLCDWVADGEIHTCFNCPHQVDYCKLYVYARKTRIPKLELWTMKQIFSCMGTGPHGDEYLDPTTLNWIWNNHRNQIVDSQPVIPWIMEPQVLSSSDNDSEDQFSRILEIASQPWEAESVRCRRASKCLPKEQLTRSKSNRRSSRRTTSRMSKVQKLAESTEYVKKRLLGSRIGFEKALSNYLTLTSDFADSTSVKGRPLPGLTTGTSTGIKIRIQVPRKRPPPPDFSQGSADMKIQIEFMKLALRIIRARGENRPMIECWRENEAFMEFYTKSVSDERWPIGWKKKAKEYGIPRYGRDPARGW